MFYGLRACYPRVLALMLYRLSTPMYLPQNLLHQRKAENNRWTFELISIKIGLAMGEAVLI